MTYKEQDLIKKQTIGELVNAWESAIPKLEKAYALMEEASQEMKRTYIKSEKSSYFSPINSDRYWRNDTEYFEKIEKEWRTSAWRMIVDLSGVRKVLSTKRVADMDKNIEDNPPDISLTSVMDMLKMIMDADGSLEKEVIEEAYDYLRPHQHEKYKTNKTFVGKKVILTNMVEPWGYGGKAFKANYYYRDALLVIDRAFHLLDGGGIPEGYNSPLVDAIETCGWDGKGETDYFIFKCHKNCNLHLTFKKQELVNELNRIAGNRYIYNE